MGLVVGAVVGFVVGLVVGAAVGFVVGAVVGAAVGFVVGLVVGAVVGFDVGAVVGAVVASVVGAVVGIVVGAVWGAVVDAVSDAAVLCVVSSAQAVTGTTLSNIIIASSKLVIRFFTDMYSFQFLCATIITDKACYCNLFFVIVTYLSLILPQKCFLFIHFLCYFSIFLH